MITVLFTMKHDKCKVFFPAIFTMMGMHVMSVGFGTLFPLLFSRNSIVYFSVFLFLFFGAMMIYEAYHLQPKSAEEKVEELQSNLLAAKDPESGIIEGAKKTPPEQNTEMNVAAANDLVPLTPSVSSNATVTSPARATKEPASIKLPIENQTEPQPKYFCTNPYLHLVVLLFLADWGDRCQISAIVLTATHNAWGVACGGALVLFCLRSGNHILNIGNGNLCLLGSTVWSFLG